MERYTQTEIFDVGNLFLPLCRKGIMLNLTPMPGLFTIRQMPYSYDSLKVYDIDHDSENKKEGLASGDNTKSMKDGMGGILSTQERNQKRIHYFNRITSGTTCGRLEDTNKSEIKRNTG
jgi:hypothetical protein